MEAFKRRKDPTCLKWIEKKEWGESTKAFYKENISALYADGEEEKKGMEKGLMKGGRAYKGKQEESDPQMEKRPSILNKSLSAK